MLMFNCFRKLLKTYHPIDPAIATPLKVNVTTSNAERFSRGSITFPDLRTLPKPQPQKTETIRVLPNRAVCDLLHPYFLQARWFEPKLEAFPGCKAEFLAHAEQIVHCDAHSRQLRHFCRLLVEKEDSTNSVGTQFGFR